MNPQRAHISGPRLDGVECMMFSEPHVGDPMQVVLEDGKMMRTSPVRQVTHNGEEIVVDTLNSRYRVTLSAA